MAVISAVEDEIWKPVLGFEKLYEVSSLGRVRSIERVITRSDGRTQFVRTRVLKQNTQTGGYMGVSLSQFGVRTPKLVHRLVLESFVGAAPDGMEACHGNGVRGDNRLRNLRWDTRSANMLDKNKHGTGLRGERNAQAKLSPAQVIDIRRRVEDGERHASIAGEYGLHRAYISLIKHRKTWAHLPQAPTTEG